MNKKKLFGSVIGRFKKEKVKENHDESKEGRRQIWYEY